MIRNHYSRKGKRRGGRSSRLRSKEKPSAKRGEKVRDKGKVHKIFREGGKCVRGYQNLKKKRGKIPGVNPELGGCYPGGDIKKFGKRNLIQGGSRRPVPPLAPQYRKTFI